ncbi:MAG: shikimate dehydrogenase [Chloroflexota bacterium]|nr:shikimate dehydrogenase [Chloroflexota bacterium]
MLSESKDIDRSRRVGLLGWPVGHSVSPAMHNAAFLAMGLAWHYQALPVHPDQLGERLAELVDSGFRGTNVTVPHKQAVVALIDEISHAARVIGAVNTVIVGPDGYLSGDNTDWQGFLHPLDGHGFDLAGKQVVLLGAGGSARAVCYALARRKVASITIWNRKAGRAEQLAVHCHSFFPEVTVAFGTDLATLPVSEADMVVNTTPVGMWPKDGETAWPSDEPLPAEALFYDLVYRPQRTLFLQQAERAGCATQDGLDMLVAQGAISIELWTGQSPPMDIMAAAALAALKK